MKEEIQTMPMRHYAGTRAKLDKVLCSSSRYIQQNTDIVTEQKPNTAYLGDAYPNPAQEMIYIPYHTNTTSQITIYDVYGKTVQNYTVQGSGVMPISVKDLPKGIYICTMTTSRQNVHKKFVVQ